MLPPREALRRTLWLVAGSGAVLAVVAAGWQGGRAALSVALGVAMALGNLAVLGRVVMALLGGVQGQGGWAGVGLLKLGALFGGAWALFRLGVADVFPFAIGYGALPLGITLSPLFLTTSTTSPSTHEPDSHA